MIKIPQFTLDYFDLSFRLFNSIFPQKTFFASPVRKICVYRPSLSGVKFTERRPPRVWTV